MSKSPDCAAMHYSDKIFKTQVLMLGLSRKLNFRVEVEITVIFQVREAFRHNNRYYSRPCTNYWLFNSKNTCSKTVPKH